MPEQPKMPNQNPSPQSPHSQPPKPESRNLPPLPPSNSPSNPALKIPPGSATRAPASDSSTTFWGMTRPQMAEMLIRLCNGISDLNAMGTSEGICKICRNWHYARRVDCAHDALREVVKRIRAETAA